VRATRLHAPAPKTQARTSSNDRPLCLENSRRAAAEYDSLPKTATLHFTLNQDTKDGNRRLAIYTSFQYKKGKGSTSQLLWDCVRLLFPEFVHDIVWNHALCTIKEDVERKHTPPPDGIQASEPTALPSPALEAEK